MAWYDEAGGTAAGAGSGALMGATLGSAIPGVGTAIGAGAGALLGGLEGYLSSSAIDKGAQTQKDAIAKGNLELQQYATQDYAQRMTDLNRVMSMYAPAQAAYNRVYGTYAPTAASQVPSVPTTTSLTKVTR